MEPQQVLSDRYVLISHLARGGMADVFVAEDRRLGRRVAVKVLHGQFASSESFVERFRREAQAAANLAHHNIVAVHDWGEDDDTYFMVMELVEGRNLRDVLRNEGALLPRRVAEIGLEVATALAVAHNQGLVHRDIKPANVLLTPDGTVKVADFGIARAWDDSDQLTRTGAVIGTATYFSPEQAQGNPADARSDIYSLGVVMYELLTGSPPFTGESPVAVAYQHVQQAPRRPSEIDPNVPPGLEAVVMKAIAKDPDHRYQSAGELIEDLQRLLAGQAPLAEPPDEGATRVIGPTPGFDDIGATPPAERPSPFPSRTTDPGYAEPDRPDRSTMVVGILAAVALLGLGLILLVRLLGSGGSDTVEIPEVRGMEAAAAQAELEDLDLRVTTENVTDSEIPAGLAVGTDPAAGMKVARDSDVTLFISAGTATVDVPRVIDLDENEARDVIEAADLEVGDVDTEPSNTIPAGIVISQSPQPGERVAAGTDVDLIVSAGSEALIVPDVRNKAEADALFTLSEAGFSAAQVRVERRPHAEVVEGFVIDTEPAAGQAVPQGGFVTLIVSEGAVPTVVPNVIGSDPDDAREQLEELGFEVVFDEPAELEWDDPLDGFIAEQDPGAGVTAEFGSRVTLRVGEAATEVAVPAVVTLTPRPNEATARQIIEDAGLVFQKGPDIELGINDPDDGRALEQSPPPGTTVAVGSTVTVRFGSAAEATTVPDVSGDGTGPNPCPTESNAVNAINAADLQPTAGSTIPLAHGDPCVGRVVAQNPAPGVEVAVDSVVTYQLGVAVLVPDVIGLDPVDVEDDFDQITWDFDGCMVDAENVDLISETDPVEGEMVPANGKVKFKIGKADQDGVDNDCTDPLSP